MKLIRDLLLIVVFIGLLQAFMQRDMHSGTPPRLPVKTISGESLLLRKLILGIQAQVRSKSLTGLIKICDALIRPASTYKNPRGVFI